MEHRGDRLRRVQIDVDTRLANVWTVAWNTLALDEENREVVGALLRAAYATGYQDALREDEEGRRGELARANGYTKGGA